MDRPGGPALTTGPRRGTSSPAAVVLRAGCVLVVVYLVVFVLLEALPGDPTDRLASPGVTPEDAARTRRALGLDRPAPIRMMEILRSYARGDLGVSFTKRGPVTDVLAAALPASLVLGGASLLLAYGLSLPVSLALLRLGRRGRELADRLLILLATLPRFWLGIMLVFVFHSWLGWLPASHAAPAVGAAPLARLSHLLLPALTLAIPSLAMLVRFQLAAMERSLAAPHVRAARSLGVAESSVLRRHVVRPNLASTAALFGLDLPVLASGALVVEIVFAWPGVGRVAADALTSGDYPLALAATLLAAGAVVAGGAVARLLESRVDPRVADALAR